MVFLTRTRRRRGLRGEGDPQGVGAGRSRPFERSLPLKAREFARTAECGKAPREGTGGAVDFEHVPELGCAATTVDRAGERLEPLAARQPCWTHNAAALDDARPYEGPGEDVGLGEVEHEDTAHNPFVR